MGDGYAKAWRESTQDAEGFWLGAARLLDWVSAPKLARKGDSWFPDGRLNICHNALDRHVAAGNGERTALIYDSPVTGVKRRFTYAQVLDQVARTGGMLRAMGVCGTDRVIIYMPMVPETVFAMLACARLGAIHSVVFGGFAAPELAKRIDDAKPVLVLSASCGLESSRVVPYKPLLDDAISLARHRPAACVVLQRPEQLAPLIRGRDHDWTTLLAAAEPVDCVPVDSAHPLYILYTSGTTGTPKGVVRDTGGWAAALAWSMVNVYGLKAGETMWTASDVGWVVGHAYIVYGPLLHGCTTVLYEGKPVGTPDAGAYWRVIREYDVDVFFTAPTAIRAIRREDPAAMHMRGGMNKLRAVFLAGERSDPSTLAWLSEFLGIPIIDHWWQTETGWPAIATCMGLGRIETVPGSAGHPVPGFRFAVLDAAGKPQPAGVIGEIVIDLPLPPGCLTTLWQNHEGFLASYLMRHPGYYSAGDAGFIDDDGRVHIMSRIDDIINVAGHRLSTAGIEQIIAGHPSVAECAVIGADDEIKGMIPVALVVRKSPATDDALNDADLCAAVVKRIREELGPVASFRTATIVDQLPKTRSGKILRSTIRHIANGEEAEVPATIESMDAVAAVRKALSRVGYPHSHRREPKQ